MSSSPLGTKTLKLKIDSVDVWTDVSKVTITSAAADSDFTSFADANAGGAREYALEFTATQDPADENSIWSQVWAHAGETIAVEVLPYGGTTVSASNPKFTGNVIVVEPDGVLLGGEADRSNTAKFTMELKWMFTAKPTKVTS